MVTAIVLVKMNRGGVRQTAERLAGLPGVSEVYSVAGEYDLVVMLRVRRNEDVQEIVTEKIHPLQEISDTQTLIAFRCDSRYDIERMFSIGFEEGKGRS